MKRIREVSGFALINVPRAPGALVKSLPLVIPVLFNGTGRTREFDAPKVSVPFSTLLDRRTGRLRFRSFDNIVEHFRFNANTRLLLTETKKNAPLERWWKLCRNSIEVIDDLHTTGVEMVTHPNFSLVMDRPRWDDLHIMKRLAIAHEEFLLRGVRPALHVNARIESDWERRAECIADREEIQDIAFEFTTGAGWSGRIDWHVHQLCALAFNNWA